LTFNDGYDLVDYQDNSERMRLNPADDQVLANCAEAQGFVRQAAAAVPQAWCLGELMESVDHFGLDSVSQNTVIQSIMHFWCGQSAIKSSAQVSENVFQACAAAVRKS
jgi:hypothetical protein